MHGLHVATLHERRARGRIDLVHTDAALERWGFGLPVVSCSLRTTDERQDATAFLDGFLPEGQARNDLAAARDVLASDTWMLLAEFGRDIAGAIVVTDPDRDPHSRGPGVEPYDDEDLADAVAALPAHPLDIHDDSELSLAGVQHKMLLVELSAGWGRPVGGRPSTHILKPDPAQHPGLVELEAAALQVAADVGLTTVTPQLVEVGGRPCLIVDRYDRLRVSPGEGEAGSDVVRVHQEDLCQATGRDPRDAGGRGKYERHGGPGFLHAARLLRTHAQDQAMELERLAGAMVFTVLIGNSDAHGKNVSLLLDPPGRVRLAPLYDTVPTMLFDHLAVRCAMEVSSVHTSLEDVTRADLIREMTGRFRWGLDDTAAQAMVDRWIGLVAAAAAERGGRLGDYVTRRAEQLSG
jgi:serine/threonine-protein kinase HipA